RPIDASSYTEEHTSEDRQVHDAPHKALYQQCSRANFSVHRARIAVNEERESACCTLAHGHGHTETGSTASDVGRGDRSADGREPPFLSAAESVPARARIRRFH